VGRVGVLNVFVEYHGIVRLPFLGCGILESALGLRDSCECYGYEG
jgi:hypothetical protein